MRETTGDRVLNQIRVESNAQDVPVKSRELSRSRTQIQMWDASVASGLLSLNHDFIYGEA